MIVIIGSLSELWAGINVWHAARERSTAGPWGGEVGGGVVGGLGVPYQKGSAESLHR